MTLPIVEAFPPPPDMVDLRMDAGQVHAGQRAQRRSWETTTGVCLHQTACLLGTRPERWRNVGAHFGVMRSGRVVWLHDLAKIIAHGNGWNTQTIGIEVDGLYAGVEGDPSTVWDDPDSPGRELGMELTPAAAEATRALIRWCCSEVARNGGVLRALVAHRQASSSRRNDPGSAIWKAVALPLLDELGLGDGGVGFKLNGGYAIPEAWDPRAKGIAY